MRVATCTITWLQGVRGIKVAMQKGAGGSSTLLRPYYLFIAPPSIEVLESRLRGRDTEKEEDVQR